ncbi:YdiU family protein [Fluoribacter dumoffii]|uniref:protein adenylyltransferase SelO n=1 Tax=Fluoribacter dumoffii TaxID=463 RepID=UPI00026C7C14|nr:YdiU family protein [Fluoribacter dumoffii]MCW8386307.1 YdiU family protein [Fluoribacter dumoffii]MCW8419360.1 YdiU family protein [Fluoribacter dumoffii]MCW8452765.1 YdiU family protein [Fluoribacter dumoffii]MCW8459985.1 YdiU family protein [Fluoribacter dumoffii]MCW8483463.1 YdiU family protein [Fluoribacter dumoffii]
MHDLTPHIYSSSYLQLPPSFYEVVAPTPIENPSLVKFNQELAAYLAVPDSTSACEHKLLTFYAGNTVPPHLKSIALAYAGHQFGYYVPLLGDGRAVLLGEIRSPDGKCWDIQLKGSGKTRFSRMGDGRAPLSAVLREYLISEAMHGLNIPTTRCLAAIASTETIYRQEGPVPLGVLTRVAASSLRVGSFEYAAAQKDNHLLKSLADYALQRHYPDILAYESPYLEFFQKVVDRQAFLIAEWMGVGFIHGVMNTDNMTISGETIDFGPCAFMDEFDLGSVFSSIDVNGRYAFGNQASIAKWNLAQFSQTLLNLVQEKESLHKLQEILDSFNTSFSQYWNTKIREKMGLFKETKQTFSLVKDFIMLLQQFKPDYTNTFRLLGKAVDCEKSQRDLSKLLGNQPLSVQWVNDWLNCVKHQNMDAMEIKSRMNQVNPAYIPRNHLVDKAIKAFIEHQDSSLMDALLAVLKNPFQQQENTEHLQSLPLPHERVHQTFCGT